MQRHVCFTLRKTNSSLNDPSREPFGNIVRKGENAGKQHFLPFPTMFSFFFCRRHILSVEPYLQCYQCLLMHSIFISLQIVVLQRGKSRNKSEV